MVLAAGISSNLVNRIDPRFLAGIGTLMAAVALFGFSRLPVRHHGSQSPDVDRAATCTDLLPFILLMSFGMGLTFVPLTLTAVHHLRAEDSGIGSGVLNTMQQVGGALGLAILATLCHPDDHRPEQDRQPAGSAMADPSRVSTRCFTEGATDALPSGRRADARRVAGHRGSSST